MPDLSHDGASLPQIRIQQDGAQIPEGGHPTRARTRPERSLQEQRGLAQGKVGPCLLDCEQQQILVSNLLQSQVYLKLSTQPPTNIEDGNYYLDTLLEQRVHRHTAEWEEGQGANKVVNWTSELPKTTITKCLCWDMYGKVDMTNLSSQLALSTLEAAGGRWDSLLGHEKARACNAVIFIARTLCSRGAYQPVGTQGTLLCLI